MTSNNKSGFHVHTPVGYAGVFVGDDIGRALLKRFISCVLEFFGTWIFVFVTTTSAALDTVGALAVGITSGFVYMGLHAMLWQWSGAHFNPWVTLANLLFGYFPGGYHPVAVISAALYAGSQILGGYVGSLCLRRLIGLNGTPVLGGTIPTAFLASDGTGLMFAEFLGTMVLVAVALQMMHPYGRNAVQSGASLYIGATLAAATSVLILIGSGGSLNIARTLGPAFVTHTYTSIGWYILGQGLAVLAAAVIHVAARCIGDPDCLVSLLYDALVEVERHGHRSRAPTTRTNEGKLPKNKRPPGFPAQH